MAQEIDAASMTFYLKYQRYQAELAGPAALADIEGLSLFSVGGIVNF